MTRFVLDPAVTLRILSERLPVGPKSTLLAPALMRSHLLDRLYAEVRAGDRSEADALALDDAFSKLKIRYLGDKVLRRRAWQIAREANAPSTQLAEYVALTQLQADALVSEDAGLRALAEGRVAIAPLSALA